MLLHIRNKFINIFKTSQCTKSLSWYTNVIFFQLKAVYQIIQVLIIE